MTYDAKLALGVGAALCDNRTLLQDRFTDSSALGSSRGPGRRNFLRQISSRKPTPFQSEAWKNFVLLNLGLNANDLIFAELRERLTVNLSTGLLDHAGLCLDRFSGRPVIPGSAVRGCARRMAIQKLLDENQPQAKTDLLYRMARVFGWGPRDWRNDSDFAWACGALWDQAAPAVEARLAADSQDPAQTASANNPRVKMAYAGRVQFLCAHPWQSPDPDLELDVALNHHPKYYVHPDSRKPFRRPATAANSPVPPTVSSTGPDRVTSPLDATGPETVTAESPGADVEDPVAAHFLAVAPGHVFAFIVLGGEPCRHWAGEWLREGLAVLGLGARTGAGYGWFDTSPELQQRWARPIQQEQQSQQRLLAEARAEQQRLAEAEAQRQAAEELEKAKESMTPAQLEDFKIAQLTDEQFRSKLQNFARHLDDKKMGPELQAIVRALRQDRIKAWEDLKQRALKGGLWAQADQAIRLAAKKANLGKMP